MGETSMIGFLLALLIGVVAGLRAMTAPAVISWATNLGWLHVGATSLAFLDYSWVRWILTATMELLKAAVDYKEHWHHVLAERARTGTTGPEPVPHPDDSDPRRDPERQLHRQAPRGRL